MDNESAMMNKEKRKGEHILVCLSSSPSNVKVIKEAMNLAKAFHASLTAIHVRSSNDDNLSSEDRARLERNMHFAVLCGASVTTVIGDDIPQQVAEYAHVSNTTKIVVGRSGSRKKHFWSRAPLTERLILLAPDLDVYIIPDSVADFRRQNKGRFIQEQIGPTLKESLITLLILSLATLTGLSFTLLGFSKENIITVFILGVIVISVMTISPLYSALGSLASVLLFNWFFIEPRFSFHTYETEYAVTFLIMLITSLIAGTLANRMKNGARQSAREAFRAKVLFDSNQLFQKAESTSEIIRITANQITTLLDKDIVIFTRHDEKQLEKGIRFESTHSISEIDKSDSDEEKIATWVFLNQRAAGLNMVSYGTSKNQYHPIMLNSHCYGVISIHLGGVPLETFENSVFISILGECALALENLRNAEEKEQAALLARNEQLRANLLRSISHDIRTPLTSISGNASNLLSHYQYLDDETRRQIFTDIHEDSNWLIELVENLLSISRIENGQMEIHRSLDVLDDVIEEALKHVDKNIVDHNVRVNDSDEILLVNMDSRLIMQVIINLVNNAIKNTQSGSDIIIETEKGVGCVNLRVCDNGPGIPDKVKSRVFDMFYTAENKVVDGRRGLGLGLALCKSIADAHGGTLTLEDNKPSGCIFTLSLPTEEVKLDE
ncbi:MAG: DUF4118 domain-containing protein [Sphaerochaetaceae bacterium]|nr:DUF4118 domain-containing protein [Sphaerochaetaceae bacterium]